MDDVGLQRAIYQSLQAQFQLARAVAQGAPPPRAQPPPQVRHAAPSNSFTPSTNMRPQPVTRPPRDIYPTTSGNAPLPPARSNGKRSTLAREGILPIPSRSPAAKPGGGGGRVASSPGRPLIEFNNERVAEQPPEWISDIEEQPLPKQRTTDAIFGWNEVCSGGRVQKQNREGTHLLLVCEDDDNGTAAVALEGTNAIFAPSAPSHSPLSSAHISLQLQNLGGRAKLSSCGIGLVSSEGGGGKHPGIQCLVIHFDVNGAVFASVEVWQHSSSTMEKVRSVRPPVPVRLQRDRLLIHLCVSCGHDDLAMNVSINQDEVFRDVALFEGESASTTTLRPALFACNGKMSLKSILIGDEPQQQQQQDTAVVSGRPKTQTGGVPVPQRKVENRLQASPKSAVPPSKSTPSGKQPAQDTSSVVLPPNVDRDLAARIENEILDRSPQVLWDDIAGMAEAKRLLNEAVILPSLVPELFTGVLQPWRGVLMFGPPGTGKTMLAKAVATSAKTTFFNMSASVLINKHLGESEKMVRTLFQVARAYSPSTIFFDEVDAIAGSAQGDHDALRRVKAELLQQMDGVHGDTSSRVIVLATTNRPWDLDEGIRRRLEKRIYIPLPDLCSRLELLRKSCKGMSIDESVHFESIARRTEGFSGADLNQLCRNAGMMPMRRLMEGKSPDQIAAMKGRGELVLGCVTEEDFSLALQKTQPSVGRDDDTKHDKWFKEFGST